MHLKTSQTEERKFTINKEQLSIALKICLLQGIHIRMIIMETNVLCNRPPRYNECAFIAVEKTIKYDYVHLWKLNWCYDFRSCSMYLNDLLIEYPIMCDICYTWNGNE